MGAIYTSATALFWLAVLGAYGFVEGVLRLFRGVPRWIKSLDAWWQNRSSEKDFYYEYREAGYRVLNPGNWYIGTRKETVVAMQQIGELPISYAWSGEGQVTCRVLPESYPLVDLPSVMGHATVRKRISFSPPLEKGNKATYNVVLECKQSGRAPDPFLSSRSSHRVDKLVLRVVFPPTIKPAAVFYVLRGGDLSELRREQITEADHLTGEYRKEIEYPRPNLYHRIEWSV